MRRRWSLIALTALLAVTGATVAVTRTLDGSEVAPVPAPAEACEDEPGMCGPVVPDDAGLVPEEPCVGPMCDPPPPSGSDCTDPGMCGDVGIATTGEPGR